MVTPAGIVTESRYESRPDVRKGHTLYGALKFKANDKTVSTSSLRWHKDDWGTDSLTAEQSIRFDLDANQRSIEPSIRYYQQKATDFYKPQVSSIDSIHSLYIGGLSTLARFNTQ